VLMHWDVGYITEDYQLLDGEFMFCHVDAYAEVYILRSSTKKTAKMWC
jgi:hypothetical protein